MHSKKELHTLALRAIFFLRYEGMPDVDKVYCRILEFSPDKPVITHEFVEWLYQTDNELHEKVIAYITADNLINR